MLRNVFLKTLWDQRRSFVWWGIGLIALALYTAGLYPSIATPEFEQYMKQLPESVMALLGGSFSLATAEGYLNAYFFDMMAPLLFALYAIVAGSGALAGEEDRGTLDVLLANPISRVQVVVEKFAALAVGMALVAFFMWFGLAATVGLVDIELDLWRLAQACLSSALLGLVFGALALAVSGLRGNRGLSGGVAVAAMLISYLIDNYASLVKEIEPFQKLSPFYYANQSRPLFNGLDMGHAIVLVAISLALLGATLLAFRARDIAV